MTKIELPRFNALRWCLYLLILGPLGSHGLWLFWLFLFLGCCGWSQQVPWIIYLDMLSCCLQLCLVFDSCTLDSVNIIVIILHISIYFYIVQSSETVFHVLFMLAISTLRTHIPLSVDLSDASENPMDSLISSPSELWMYESAVWK